MRNFGKLVNFELNRFMKIYLALIGVTIVSQFAGVIFLSRRYLQNAHEIIQLAGTPTAEFIEMFGRFSMRNITQSLWFIAPIALAVAALIFYMFLIWYRDWFSKNTFIYRLLTLPTTRLNIYLAKAAAIMLMIFGLVAIQLLLLPLENLLLQSIIPAELMMDLSISQILTLRGALPIIIPQNFTDFLWHYGIGFMVLNVLFTLILLERSFGIKGIALAILYGAGTVILFISPVLLQEFYSGRLLHPIEVFILLIVTGIIVISMSIYLSHYLLKNKITV